MCSSINIWKFEYLLRSCCVEGIMLKTRNTDVNTGKTLYLQSSQSSRKSQIITKYICNSQNILEDKCYGEKERERKQAVIVNTNVREGLLKNKTFYHKAENMRAQNMWISIFSKKVVHDIERCPKKFIYNVMASALSTSHACPSSNAISFSSLSSYPGCQHSPMHFNIIRQKSQWQHFNKY